MRFAGAKLRKKTEVFYDSDRVNIHFYQFFGIIPLLSVKKSDIEDSAIMDTTRLKGIIQ